MPVPGAPDSLATALARTIRDEFRLCAWRRGRAARDLCAAAAFRSPPRTLPLEERPCPSGILKGPGGVLKGKTPLLGVMNGKGPPLFTPQSKADPEGRRCRAQLRITGAQCWRPDLSGRSGILMNRDHDAR